MTIMLGVSTLTAVYICIFIEKSCHLISFFQILHLLSKLEGLKGAVEVGFSSAL